MGEKWLDDADVQFAKSLALSVKKSRACKSPDLNLRHSSGEQKLSSGKAGVGAAGALRSSPSENLPEPPETCSMPWRSALIPSRERRTLTFLLLLNSQRFNMKQGRPPRRFLSLPRFCPLRLAWVSARSTGALLLPSWTPPWATMRP